MDVPYIGYDWKVIIQFVCVLLIFKHDIWLFIQKVSKIYCYLCMIRHFLYYMCVVMYIHHKTNGKNNTEYSLGHVMWKLNYVAEIW